jgi:hypothetical protein
MSVYKSKGSKSFRYDFWCGGYRFVGNCGESKTKREAKSVERKARIEAREEIARLNTLKGGPLTLDYAAGRYFAERGQHHAVPATALTNLNRILKFLGKDKLLSDITDNDVAKLIAWRRGHRVKDRKTAPLVSLRPLIALPLFP